MSKKIYTHIKPPIILNILILLINVIFNINCSTLKNIPIYNDIRQGNYLSQHDIQKIHIGMNKSEISCNIGSPTLKDLFELNIWYYIYYHQYKNGTIKQKIVTLEFDENNKLINVKKKEFLPKK